MVDGHEGGTPRAVEGSTWHRNSGTSADPAGLPSPGMGVTGMWVPWRGGPPGSEVVSHGSGFGDCGQGGKPPPDFSALRWLQDVGKGFPLLVLEWPL